MLASDEGCDIVDGGICGFECSDRSRETVKHSLPDVESYVDAGLFGALCKTHGIIEQHFIIADVDAERRKRRNVLRQR